MKRWKFLKARKIISLCGLSLSVQLSPVTSYACEPLTERKIVDSLLNADPGAAQAFLDQDLSHYQLIPSPTFYAALIDWYKKLIDNRLTNQKLDKTALFHELDILKSQFEENPSPRSQLSWGLAGALTARALFANNQALSGYRAGIESVENLQTYLKDPQSDKPGRAAASLITGLYYLYTNYIPEEFQWLDSRVTPHGSIEEAIRLIEFSTRHSTILGPEAARILLFEVPWRLPDHCKYQSLAKQLLSNYPNNTDISLVYQGLHLRCGHSETALTENKRIFEAGKNGDFYGYGNYDYAQLIELSSYRIHANLGNTTMLNEGDRELKWHRKFARANSLDTVGNRDSAIKIYQSLTTDTMAPSSIRKSAEIRVSIPYHPPETITQDSSLKFPECTNPG